MTSIDAGRDVSDVVTVVWSRDDAFVAHAGRVVGVRWIGVPTAEQLVALSQAHRVASEIGDVLLVNDVVRLTGSTRVEPRIHQHMLRLIEQARDRTCAVAHVIEVPGPVGAIVRAFLTALEQLAGNGTRTACFASPSAAATWLSHVAGGAVPETEIGSAWRAMELAVESSLAA